MTSARRDVLILLLLCAVTFGWRLGHIGLIDPDEPFYAQSATEMLAQHDWVTPRIFGHPQFEKPILFYTLEMASIRLFGHTETAERLPAAVFGTLLVLLTYAFGARVLGREAGLWSALVLGTGALYMGCSRMVLTDVIFAFFVCGCCFACWAALDPVSPRQRAWLLAGLFAGGALLTKGPLGLAIPVLACVTAAGLSRPLARPRGAMLAGGVALMFLVAAPWYGVMLARYGMDYVRAFFVHENIDRLLYAEHGSNNHFYYYPAVLVIGSLPWIPAIAVTLARLRQPLPNARVWRFLLCWLGSSIVLFTAAASKLPTYVLFAFVPLSLLVGGTIAALVRGGFRHSAERRLAIGAALVQALAMLALPVLPATRGVGTVPLALTGVALLAAALLVAGRRFVAWGWTSALAGAGAIVALMIWSPAALESGLSMRPVATMLRLSGTLDTPGGRDSIYASPVLVRGLVYYSGVTPLVVSQKPNPFWTDSRIPIVVGAAAMTPLLRSGSVRCVLRPSEWKRMRRELPVALLADSLHVGNKILLGAPVHPLASAPARTVLR